MQGHGEVGLGFDQLAPEPIEELSSLLWRRIRPESDSESVFAIGVGWRHVQQFCNHRMSEDEVRTVEFPHVGEELLGLKGSLKDDLCSGQQCRTPACQNGIRAVHGESVVADVVCRHFCGSHDLVRRDAHLVLGDVERCIAKGRGFERQRTQQASVVHHIDQGGCFRTVVEDGQVMIGLEVDRSKGPDCEAFEVPKPHIIANREPALTPMKGSSIECRRPRRVEAGHADPTQQSRTEPEHVLARIVHQDGESLGVGWFDETAQNFGSRCRIRYYFRPWGGATLEGATRFVVTSSSEKRCSQGSQLAPTCLIADGTPLDRGLW